MRKSRKKKIQEKRNLDGHRLNRLSWSLVKFEDALVPFCVADSHSVHYAFCKSTTPRVSSEDDCPADERMVTSASFT